VTLGRSQPRIFLREGFPRRLFGRCAGALGGTSVTGFATSQAGSRAVLGIVLCLVAVIAYSAAVVVQKSVVGRVSALQVTWLGCAAATVACLPFAPLLVRDVGDAGATAIGWTVHLGIVPTAIGFATWTFALQRTSAGRMGAMIYLIPPIAVLLWLGDSRLGAAAGGCRRSTLSRRRLPVAPRLAGGAPRQQSTPGHGMGFLGYLRQLWHATG
jgi:drug/metabolite transporter (DMT)-like permease